MIDDGQYRIEYINHKNTRIRGSIEIDEDGFATIYINARNAINHQLDTVDHELRHLMNDDAYNDKPLEDVERIAAGYTLPAPIPANLPDKRKRPIPQNLKKPADYRRAIKALRLERPENHETWDYLLDLFSHPPRDNDEVKLRGFLMYGFEPDDPRWQTIFWASLHPNGFTDYSNYDNYGQPRITPHSPRLRRLLKNLFD